MKVKKSYISLLTLLLVIGSVLGNQSSAYAFSSTETTTLESTVGTDQNTSTNLSYQLSDKQQLIAEIGEEISEEQDKTVKTTKRFAVTHAYYNSYLRFLSFSPTSKIQFFDTSSLVSTTPIYIQNEVFRL